MQIHRVGALSNRRFCYTFTSALTDFTCGLAGVVHGRLGPGYITALGDLVIRLDSAVPHYEGFSEGLAPVWDKKSGLLGYITTNGTFAIAPRFKGAGAFHEGRAAVRVAMKDETGWPVYKWGAIDIDGKLVVPAQYKTVWSFEEGMDKIVADTGSGFVNLAGELVVPCAFQNVEPFKNGLASVEVGSCLHMDTVWKGYINKKGEFVWRPSNYKTLDEARAKVTAEEERKPSIVLRKDAGTNEKGLLVPWPKKVLFTGDKAVIPIRVDNRLETDVVIDPGSIREAIIDLESWDGGGIGGGETLIVTEGPKRLAASRYSDKRRSSSNGCVAIIKGEIKGWVVEAGRSRGTMGVFISGYRMDSNESFSDIVELPIEFEKVPTNQPVTVIEPEPMVSCAAEPTAPNTVKTFDGPSTDLKSTQFVPTLETPITNGENAVWCSSFLAAWKSLAADVAQADISLEGAPQSAVLLTKADDPRPYVPTGALYVATGWKSQGVVDRISKELGRGRPQRRSPCARFLLADIPPLLGTGRNSLLEPEVERAAS